MTKLTWLETCMEDRGYFLRMQSIFPDPRSPGMLARSFLFLTALGWATAFQPAPLAAADAAAPPTLIVRFPSIDGVIGDLKYLAGLAGREAESKHLDDQLKKTLPKGFAGIDTKRPLGAYGILDLDGNLQDI